MGNFFYKLRALRSTNGRLAATKDTVHH